MQGAHPLHSHLQLATPTPQCVQPFSYASYHASSPVLQLPSTPPPLVSWHYTAGILLAPSMRRAILTLRKTLLTINSTSSTSRRYRASWSGRLLPLQRPSQRDSRRSWISRTVLRPCRHQRLRTFQAQATTRFRQCTPHMRRLRSRQRPWDFLPILSHT